MSGRVRLKEEGSSSNVGCDSTPSLLEICFNYMAENLSIISTGSKNENTLELRDGIVLPFTICNRFFKHYQDYHQDVHVIVNLFRDPSITPIKYVSIRYSLITDDELKVLLRHNLISLSIWYCHSITDKSYETLLQHSSQLRSLELGRNVYMLKHEEPNEKSPFNFQLSLPRLERLIMVGVVLQPSLQFSHLVELSYLDLTACIFAEFSLEALVGLPKLTTLILFNVWPLEKEFPHLCQMKQLEVLDISVAPPNGHGIYKEPDLYLATLVESLPRLTHLDISGTNLAGRGVAKKESNGNGKNSDIPGLVSRVDRPLEFLGLYNTAHSACRRHDIPALTIAGEANEEQILTSALMYRDRPNLLTKVLNDLYYILRSESCQSIHKALKVVLMAMDRHLPIKHTQISGSATLFYIVKGRNTNQFGPSLKKHIIRTLLNGMSTHMTDDTMMRNGCLTLCQFSIPNDVLFEYERVVTILLDCVFDSDDENFVQRIAVFLLNSMASRVDKCQKLFLGNIGTISTMLNLISKRLNRNTFDDVLEVAWATMWNVTDETAVNCTRFLDLEGMKYFLGCLRSFPDKPELLRNMLGLLGNVAEVPELRPRLMTSELISVFSDLLNSTSDGIEVSYNAAGVLAHIASDGPEIWTITTPTREEVLMRMVMAIERWDLWAERNINYRSMEPIFRLVRCYEIPQCQHWAVWALANLTKVYPTKYCHLVESEHGIELLNELLAHPMPYDRIKELAHMVLENCRQEKESEMIYEG